jgi:PAS domain S-box-containing protein
MPNRLAKSRRGAHVESAQSTQFYRQLADLSPNMLWSAKPDGSTDYLNSRVLQYTGCTHQQLEGWGWRKVVHPDDWQRCSARWTKAFTKGQPYEVEYRLKRHDGKYLWHLSAAMPVREGGRILRWFGSCTEIENQKRSERLLEKARGALGTLLASRSDGAVDARFRTLLESAPVMIWQSGPDKLCTFFSRPWLDFTGRSAEQEMGAGWAEGVHPDDLKRCLATYEEAFDARIPFEMEYRLRRHDGKYRLIFDRGVPLVDPSRGFLGYVGSCVDITDRHSARLELEGPSRPDALVHGQHSRHRLDQGCALPLCLAEQ